LGLLRVGVLSNLLLGGFLGLLFSGNFDCFNDLYSKLIKELFKFIFLYDFFVIPKN
jgi:hypothetical protein